MNLNIRGENIAVTPALQAYAEKRIGKLEKYFNTPLHVRMNMRVHNKIQVVEVTIPIQGLLLRAEVGQEDMYAAIDAVVSKLERQIKKYKTKLNRKSRQDKREVLHASAAGTATKTQTKTKSDQGFEVVRRKSFVMKPMTAEEAILQMDMLGHSFFVFNNAENGEISVVYRRKDGRYGLIDQGEEN
ncbi:MAG: ribosome-associated translation inhibitor RaiA [Sporolactobacillus sp.]|jgi:putative sigma-54 modulation protein|nr:ribosome-associated translation inhibitor RaiA [Sporolactobacillus sp.]